MRTPRYTVFPNTTSAERCNDELPDRAELAVPVKSPHNAINLAIGGIQIPSQNAAAMFDANGDIDENETASFDPIIFFHH